MYQIIQYIKFLYNSTNQHGIHSPFVFNLATKCFYDKTKYEDYSIVKAYRNQLLKNRNTLTVKDLGVGSKINNTSKRKISKMAKVSGSSWHRVKLLYRLNKYFKFKQILELGTSLGMATNALALANKNSKITSIEGAPEIANFARIKLKQLQNVEIKTGSFDKVLNALENTIYDFVFFDGNHQKEATLKYFETLLPKIHNNSEFIFDDIYWSKDMTKAWEVIKKHPKVTVTIDTFFWGFVFFRKEQAKEHFIIRV